MKKLTKEERNVLYYLAIAYNEFIKLEEYHPSAQSEFHQRYTTYKTWLWGEWLTEQTLK
jgi:hypothetical protein